MGGRFILVVEKDVQSSSCYFSKVNDKWQDISEYLCVFPFWESITHKYEIPPKLSFYFGRSNQDSHDIEGVLI